MPSDADDVTWIMKVSKHIHFSDRDFYFELQLQL